jgi:hypothetical protein
MEPVFYILAFVAYFIYRIWLESQKLKKQAREQAEKLPPPPVAVPAVTKKKVEMVSRTTVIRKHEAPSGRDEFKQREVTRKPEQKHLQKKSTGRIKPDAESRSLETVFSEAEEAEKYEMTERKAMEDEHLSPYALAKKGVNPYASLLKNPQSVKTAFVLSQILERKY